MERLLLSSANGGIMMAEISKFERFYFGYVSSK